MLISLDVRLVHPDSRSRRQDRERRKPGKTPEWLFGGYEETYTRHFVIYIRTSWIS
jgi:hypothetical protein